MTTLAEMHKRDKRRSELEAENERLRDALASAPCPAGGWTGQPKEIVFATVADCLKHKVCGCNLGDALSPQQGPGGAK